MFAVQWIASLVMGIVTFPLSFYRCNAIRNIVLVNCLFVLQSGHDFSSSYLCYIPFQDTISTQFIMYWWSYCIFCVYFYILTVNICRFYFTEYTLAKHRESLCHNFFFLKRDTRVVALYINAHIAPLSEKCCEYTFSFPHHSRSMKRFHWAILPPLSANEDSFFITGHFHYRFLARY